MAVTHLPRDDNASLEQQLKVALMGKIPHDQRTDRFLYRFLFLFRSDLKIKLLIFTSPVMFVNLLYNLSKLIFYHSNGNFFLDFKESHTFFSKTYFTKELWFVKLYKLVKTLSSSVLNF